MSERPVDPADFGALVTAAASLCDALRRIERSLGTVVVEYDPDDISKCRKSAERAIEKIWARRDQGEGKTMGTVSSTSDERTVNNVMRHAYRVLSDEEKAAMQKVKDEGLAFHEFLSSLGSSRELAVAKTKIKEAVMWAVKHITA